jgi:hypothetical protein
MIPLHLPGEAHGADPVRVPPQLPSSIRCAPQVLATRAVGSAVLTQERVLSPDIRKGVHLVRSGSMVRAARAATSAVSSC